MIAAFALSLAAPLQAGAHSRFSAYSDLYGGTLIRASYYDSGYRTASGEHFNPNGFTAAHRTLPFGTRLAVINPANGRKVIVRINDRGPFVRGVSLDLARGAAFALGMRGTGPVRIAVVSRGAEQEAGYSEGIPQQEAYWQEPRSAHQARSNDATRFWGSPFERALD